MVEEGDGCGRKGKNQVGEVKRSWILWFAGMVGGGNEAAPASGGWISFLGKRSLCPDRACLTKNYC